MGEDVMGSGAGKSERHPNGVVSALVVPVARALRRSAQFVQSSLAGALLPQGSGRGQRSDGEDPLPALTAAFLPEFPQQIFPGREDFQVLGVIAKGSFGPVVKVKEAFGEKIFAVKVLPKAEILRHGVLEQVKDEVTTQQQLQHPFILGLQDCWQTQRYLFIMCEFCSVGDLYTSWALRGAFGEDDVRLFAAELGSALGFLHSSRIMHRDVKMENILLSGHGHLRLSDFGLCRRLKRGGRTSTICGTIEYMAPEVLSGGPYDLAADWWSLGIVMFSLLTGEFPLLPESHHSSMLAKVMGASYLLPQTFSAPLRLLLTELLCKNPAKRLKNLKRFKAQSFFSGFSFDAETLQKRPVHSILELRNHPDWAVTASRGLSAACFQDFDGDDVHLSEQVEEEEQTSITLEHLF